MTLTIRTQLPSLNQTISTAKAQQRYYSPYASMKSSLEATIVAEILAQLRQYEQQYSYLEQWIVPESSCFHFKWFCKDRRRDPDNIASNAKFVFDALVKSGRLESDGWKFVANISHEFHVDKDDPRLELIVTDFQYSPQAIGSQ